MLRTTVRQIWVGVLGLALSVPVGVEGQARRTGPPRAQTPPTRVPAAAPRGAVRSNAAARARSPEAARNARGPVRGDARDRRGDRREDRWDDRRDDRWEDRRDDRWDDRWERDRRERRRWQLHSEADLRLFGFLGVNVRWDRYDALDRRRWVDRYRSYDGWGRFAWNIDGWHAPRWGAFRFDRDPLRYGPRRLDARDLRRILGKQTFRRAVRGTPGGVGHLWGRVERFGPRGTSITLEIWSGPRFVMALTDFDRDLWVDDVVVNGRVWR